MGIILIVLSLLAVAVAVYMATTGVKATVDEHGCLKGSAAPVAHTIILIDQTDSLNPRELDFVRTVIFNEFHRLPLTGKLSIRSIDEQIDQGKDPLIVCRLKTGEESGGPTENAKMVKRSFEKRVGQPLSTFLAGLSKQSEKQWSPIYETIADVYNRIDFNPEMNNRRLVVISDMAQHSPAFDQYGCWRRGFSVPAGMDRDFATNVPGSEIVIQYIKRKKLCMQGERHRQFWESLYSSMGADISIGHSLKLGRGPDEKVIYEAE